MQLDPLWVYNAPSSSMQINNRVNWFLSRVPVGGTQEDSEASWSKANIAFVICVEGREVVKFVVQDKRNTSVGLLRGD